MIGFGGKGRTDVVACSKLYNTGEAGTSAWLLVEGGSAGIAWGASITLFQLVFVLLK